MKRVSLFVIVLLFVMSMGVVAGGFEFVGGPTISKIDVDLNIKAEYEEIQMMESAATNQELPVLGISLKSEEGAAGYYAGARYLFDNGFGVGVGYERQSFNTGLALDVDISEEPEFNVNLNLDNKLSGPYLEGLYEINEMFTLRGAIISNSFTSTFVGLYDDSESIDIAKGSGLGYQIGAEVSYPITDKLSILSSASYITGTVDIDKVYHPYREELVGLEDLTDDINEEIYDYNISDLGMELDYSGFKFALGVNYSF